MPRHVTFDSLSRKIASPEVTQCERADISLHRPRSFCAGSFRAAPERPSKSTWGQNFARQIGGKRADCELFAYDFDRAHRARPMSLVPVKALHVSILSRIIAFRYSPSNSIVFHAYLYTRFKSDNDVATTNPRFIGGSSDIYICKFCKDISIFHPAREQRSSCSAGFLLFFIV